VAKHYNVHVYLNGISFFVKDGRQRMIMRDPAIHPPCTLLKTMSEFEIFCNKVVNLPSKYSQRSWISARWPAMKFYMRIVARENWKPDSYYTVELIKSKRRIVLQFVVTSCKLQARMIHNALPSSLQKKHNAYYMTHKQKDKTKSGEAQTHLPRRNLSPNLQKQKQCWLIFFNCRAVVHNESVH
jgi:hypothetical protein